MKMKNLAVVLLMLSATGWARDWRQMRDEADRNLPPNVKWYLEQREKKDWFLQDGPFGDHGRLPELPDSAPGSADDLVLTWAEKGLYSDEFEERLSNEQASRKSVQGEQPEHHRGDIVAVSGSCAGAELCLRAERKSQ